MLNFCVCVYFCVCLSRFSCVPAGDDLEPGLSRAGDKEPRADNQPPHRCRPLHVFQHRWQPPRHLLQGQEGPTHGATLRKPTAGNASHVYVCVFYLCLVLLLLQYVQANRMYHVSVKKEFSVLKKMNKQPFISVYSSFGGLKTQLLNLCGHNMVKIS